MLLLVVVMQAVMGTLVKRFLAKKLGLKPEQIYHCAVMPCYDKKLEGSREDFMIPGERSSLHWHSTCWFALLYADDKCQLTFLVV